MDWNSIAKASQEAFREAVNEWIGRARVTGGQVTGPNAKLVPGSLFSDVSIEERMMQRLMRSKVPSQTARALAKVLAAAWNDWAAGFQMQIAGAYPRLAAVPGPIAPPTPAAAPIPLSRGSSSGEASLKSSLLASKLRSALATCAKEVPGRLPDDAVKNLAGWVESSFNEWKGLVKITGLMGKGPVPTYAPPYVPVGPVAMGDNISAPGTLFSGPRFGKLVF